jgi:hypothetical protein
MQSTIKPLTMALLSFMNGIVVPSTTKTQTSRLRNKNRNNTSGELVCSGKIVIYFKERQLMQRPEENGLLDNQWSTNLNVEQHVTHLIQGMNSCARNDYPVHK